VILKHLRVLPSLVIVVASSWFAPKWLPKKQSPSQSQLRLQLLQTVPPLRPLVPLVLLPLLQPLVPLLLLPPPRNNFPRQAFLVPVL
jgi:hypothetical protein